MNSLQLVVLEGPLAGQTFALPEGPSTIGRGSHNTINLRDSGASRDHCLLERSGDRLRIVDRGSHNGTFVNGERLSERDLVPEDRLLIGASLLLLVASDAPPGQESREFHTIDATSSELFTDPGLQSEPDSILASNRSLRMLLRLSSMLHSFHALHNAQTSEAQASLARHLLALFLEILPFDSAAVLTTSTSPAAPYLTLAETGAPLTIDPHILQRISAQRVALLAPGGPQSILAAPILLRDEIEAVLYFTSTQRNGFNDGHLQLVTALSGMAAVAWENAALLQWLRVENDQLRDAVGKDHGMAGHSKPLKDLQTQIERVAPSNSTVLILGESGTGKELIARSLHRHSPRAAAPFVAINCAALTDTLLESELFGYEKGAFTGALSQRKGKLEAAAGGTVFLDEIGELSPLLQAKFLRVLQERELQRVGGTQTIKLDIRVIAATNRDLAEAARKGDFRQDLYYRLNVVTLKAPSLRQRPDDILPLAEHFAIKFAQQCGRKVAGLSPQAKAYLQSYSWPGNVRELENAIERAVVLGAGDTILPEDLPENIREERPAELSVSLYEEAVEQAKKQVVLRAFEQAGYEHEPAAQLLGLHPNYLHRLIRALDLRAALKAASRSR